MARQLFGTDGVRGVAGEDPLDPATVHALGEALGEIAPQWEQPAAGIRPSIVIGADTRESSPWIARQFAGGLARAGLEVRHAGVITTPGVAWLTRTGPFVAGVMISASHNPYQDNGIKIFGHSGYKLPDEEEHAIEERTFRLLAAGVKPEPAALVVDQGLDVRYADHLLETAGVSLNNLSMVVDCGNGAASQIAPGLFRRAGAQVRAMHCTPDGRNINLNCGALHVDSIREEVLTSGAGLGVAFDGDADRAIFVSSSGRVVDGDAVLLIAARDLLASGALPGHTVVATVMSNLGLEKALGALGVRLLRTPVGDKYVLEGMLRSGAPLGGEQSGHIIFGALSTTCDGLLTALRIVGIMERSGATLDELAADLKVYPQRLVNVRVREKKALHDLPAVAAEVRACERALGGSGRILVRFSGTEPLARVMVEALDPRQVEEFSARIADAIQREIG